MAVGRSCDSDSVPGPELPYAMSVDKKGKKKKKEKKSCLADNNKESSKFLLCSELLFKAFYLY